MMTTRLVFADKSTGLAALPKLTPEQDLELEPLRREYERALTQLTTAQHEYMEAYGAFVVATRRITGDI
jgi:hypothetical protein